MRNGWKSLGGLLAAVGVLAACASEQPPVIGSVVATPATVAPGGTVSISAVATSPQNQPLSYAWTVPSGWTAKGATNQPVLVLTAPATFATAGVAGISVTDKNGGSAASQALVATEADQAPVFTTLSASPNPAAPGGTVTLSAVATSPTGNPVTYSWTSSDSAWTVAGSGGNATLTAPAKYGASSAITVVASDGTLKATGTLVVTTTATASPVLKAIVATPPMVAPKGTIQLTAQAQSPDGQPLSYAWSVADSSWTISGSGPTATLTAPASYASSSTASVSVTDAAGASVSGSVAVATTPDATPVVSSISWNPTNPNTNQVVTLGAIASVPAEGATLAWTFVSLPQGSKATLTGSTTPAPTFTPDLPGSYVVGVILTDAAGTPSRLQTATIGVGSPTPTAVIAGSSPLSGSINTPILLDGSGSSTPTGDALTYWWSLQSGPLNASCGFFADASKSAQGNNLPKAYLACNMAGSYLVQLTVQDALTGQSAFATMGVNLVGAASLKVVSGDKQTATVHQFLPSPVVLQVVAADGSTPIPGMRVAAYAAGGAVTANSVTSDSSGKVQLIVQAGRIAVETGIVSAWLANDPTITAAATFSATADKAASFALVPTMGNADTGASIKVQAVDQFGNLATDNAAANTAQLTLTAQSSSGKANFGGGTPSATAKLTLVGGVASTTLLDPVSEPVTLTLTPTSSLLPLPYTAWQTVEYDNGMGLLNGWGQSQTGGQSPWAVETAAGQIDGAIGDVVSYGLGLNPSQSLSTGASQLFHNVFNAGSIELLSFNQQLSVQGAYDAASGCEAQPAFAATVVNARRTEYRDPQGNPLIPVGGYAMSDACGHGLSFGATNGWVSQSYDLTDALAQGYDLVDFGMWNGGDGQNPPQPASWDLGQIWVRYLSAPNPNQASTFTVILPGAAKTVAFTQANFGQSYNGVLFGQCVSYAAATGVAIEAFDQNGNQAYSNGTLDIAWTNGSNAALAGASTGSIVTAAPGSAEVQLSLGRAALEFDFASASSSTLTLSNPSSGLTLGSQATATAQAAQYYCHSDGVGGNWSDDVPTGTLTQPEATLACENVYGAGNCTNSATSSYVYPTGAVAGCNTYYMWYYAAATINSACGGTFSPMAGSLDQGFFIVGCGCNVTAGVGGPTYDSFCGGTCNLWN